MRLFHLPFLLVLLLLLLALLFLFLTLTFFLLPPLLLGLTTNPVFLLALLPLRLLLDARALLLNLYSRVYTLPKFSVTFFPLRTESRLFLLLLQVHGSELSLNFFQLLFVQLDPSLIVYHTTFMTCPLLFGSFKCMFLPCRTLDGTVRASLTGRKWDIQKLPGVSLVPIPRTGRDGSNGDERKRGYLP